MIDHHQIQLIADLAMDGGLAHAWRRDHVGNEVSFEDVDDVFSDLPRCATVDLESFRHLALFFLVQK